MPPDCRTAVGWTRRALPAGSSLRPVQRAVLGVVLVAGGTLGTGARAWLQEAFGSDPGQWPWTTFGVNVIGSFCLGALVAGLARRGPDTGRRRLLRLGLGTGLIGGFTTYSAFMIEVEGLLSGGAEALGLGYAVGSVVLGVVAAAGGLFVGDRFPAVGGGAP